MSKKIWKDTVDPHDFDAAENYLCLLTEPHRAKEFRDKLERCTHKIWVHPLGEDTRTETPPVYFKAKDILRASGLKALPRTNTHVAADLKKIHNGVLLSPILLLRDSNIGHALIIPDGYHRVCASYLTDENLEIPCYIASF